MNSAPPYLSPMSNVIRPIFGTKSQHPSPDDWTQVEIIGTAAGHTVGLHRATNAKMGSVIRVVVGAAGSATIDAIAIYTGDEEADQNARTCALAALRAMEIVGGEGPGAV